MDNENEPKQPNDQVEKDEEQQSEEVDQKADEVVKETPTEETSTDEEATTISSPINQFQFNVGDTVVVSSKVHEDNRTRTQKFEGVVIAKKGDGMGITFTVRRIGINDVGVERIFPLHSPLIEDIEVKRQGHPRRSKLYYLRTRKGRAATFVKPR